MSRTAYIIEPNDNDKLCKGIMEKCSGGDKIYFHESLLELKDNLKNINYFKDEGYECSENNVGIILKKNDCTITFAPCTFKFSIFDNSECVFGFFFKFDDLIEKLAPQFSDNDSDTLLYKEYDKFAALFQDSFSPLVKSVKK